MKNKWALGGILVSFTTSIIAFFYTFMVNSNMKATGEKQTLIDLWVEGGSTIEEATEMFTFMLDITSRLQTYFLVFSMMSVVLFVLYFIIKPTNQKSIGFIFITAAILHVITFRFVSFFLLIMAGIKMVKASKYRQSNSTEAYNQTL